MSPDEREVTLREAAEQLRNFAAYKRADGAESRAGHIEQLADKVEIDDDSNESRHPLVGMYLCKECGEGFEDGDEIVALTDGAVFDGEYHVANRRMFHEQCWLESQYMSKDIRREAQP